jgi:hypothetical protein
VAQAVGVRPPSLVQERAFTARTKVRVRSPVCTVCLQGEDRETMHTFLVEQVDARIDGWEHISGPDPFDMLVLGEVC